MANTQGKNPAGFLDAGVQPLGWPVLGKKAETLQETVEDWLRQQLGSRIPDWPALLKILRSLPQAWKDHGWQSGDVDRALRQLIKRMRDAGRAMPAIVDRVIRGLESQVRDVIHPQPSAPAPAPPTPLDPQTLQRIKALGGEDDYGWVLARRFLEDFLTGRGPAVRVYGPNAFETRQLMASKGVQQARAKAYALRKDDHFGFKTLPAAVETFLGKKLQNATLAQLGAYTVSWHIDHQRHQIRFEVVNKATLKSLMLHATPERWNPTPNSGPMATIEQRFWWVEKFPE